MATFFCRLLPPRATFAADMSPEEAGLMQDHARYWSAGIAAGQVYGFGFVADAAGPFGIGIVEAADEAAARAFTAGDPVILRDAGFRYEISLMPMGLQHR